MEFSKAERWVLACQNYKEALLYMGFTSIWWTSRVHGKIEVCKDIVKVGVGVKSLKSRQIRGKIILTT